MTTFLDKTDNVFSLGLKKEFWYLRIGLYSMIISFILVFMYLTDEAIKESEEEPSQFEDIFYSVFSILTISMLVSFVFHFVYKDTNDI